MDNCTCSHSVTERELVMALNEGLMSAIYVLERVEYLSAEGLKYLLDELKKQVVESEDALTAQLPITNQIV